VVPPSPFSELFELSELCSDDVEDPSEDWEEEELEDCDDVEDWEEALEDEVLEDCDEEVDVDDDQKLVDEL